jgi:hypothetical protein
MTVESTAASGATPPSRRGGASPSAGGDDAAQRQLAWQREMERAQMTGWFKPASAGGTDTAAESANRAIDERARGQGGSERRGGSRRFLQANPLDAAGLTVAPAAGSPVASPMAERAAGASAFAVRAATGVSTPPSTAVEVEPTAASDFRIESRLPLRQGAQANMGLEVRTPSRMDDSTDAASDALQAKPSEQLAPVRLHEEATPQGQAVWIAMRADDDALTAMLPQLVADLQHGLLERGQRLHQVVCNGRLVWREGAPALPDHKLISRIDNCRAYFDSIDSKEA